MRPPLPDDPAGVLHGEPEHDEGQRRLGHAVVLAQVVLHSLRQQRRVWDLVVYFYIHLNIMNILLYFIVFTFFTLPLGTCSRRKTAF